jgi:hypothetical protein
MTAIWWRVLQQGEFFSLERTKDAGPDGGGGAGYIEVPKTLTVKALQFFEQDSRTALTTGFTVRAVPIGSTDNLAYPIDFKPKSNDRLRIANQNRQTDSSQRHPAWSAAFGFPKAPDDVQTTPEAAAYLPLGGVRVFVGKLDDGTFIAGFTSGPPPANRSPTSELYRLWINSGVGDVIWDIDIPLKEGN